MKNTALLGLIVVLVAGGVAPAQYHDPVYITGGYNAVSSIYTRGIFLADGSARTLTTFILPRYYSYGFRMDVGNRQVVFQTGVQFSSSTVFTGPHAGLYRFDPATQKISTIRYDTMSFYRPYKLHVNQDGDYVLGANTRNWTGTRTEYHYRILKVDRTGVLTTVLTTQSLGRPAYFYGGIQTNIDTGNYLICDMYSLLSAGRWFDYARFYTAIVTRRSQFSGRVGAQGSVAEAPTTR